MPLVFFSGGIDSVALAWDVATHPYRYGVADVESSHLILLSYTESGQRAKKTKNLRPLLSALERVSKLPIEHRVEECTIPEYVPLDIVRGGMSALDPLSAQYTPDIAAMPFCAGQIMWAASYAINFLRELEQPFSPELALFGFQYDGPSWKQHDEGRLRKNDVSPEFVAGLNAIAKATGETHVSFRAPFLENRMDRTQVVQLAMEVGVPLHLTSSCIAGWKKNCGVCAQCMRRQRTFKALGVKDV